jgi:hypothetical protein
MVMVMMMVVVVVMVMVVVVMLLFRSLLSWRTFRWRRLRPC